MIHGSVTNSAFATGTFNETNVTSNTDTATVTAVQSPGLLINKSANPTTYSVAGDIVTYTYNITNTGNVNITGPITVTDDKVGTVTATGGNLSPGQSVFVHASYIVTQSDLDNGSVTNAAYATGTVGNNTTTSNTANETVTAVQPPALLIDKSASPSTYDSVGDIITYTYNVTNTGNVNIKGPINVTDDKVGNVTATLGNLTPGQSVFVNATYTIIQSDLDFGSVINAAYATGTLGNNTTTSNTNSATVTAIQSPSLLINKSASPSTYDSVGDIITYTYNVTNTGNVNITGPITVTDNVTGTAQILVSTLEPGQNVTGTANYTITQADLDSGFVTNSAFATGTFNGNNVTSNPDTETVTANQCPALLTVKIASPTTYSSVGENITYTYNVNNTGNVGISAPINVTDNRIGTFTISNIGLAPGQNVTGTANYTVTQDDLDSGSVTNAAFATGTFNGTEVNSTNVTATVIAIQSPALLTVKIASPETYSSVGQNITYTYNVTNSGNVIISGPINVTDDKVGQYCNCRDLNPGQNVTGTANYTVTQEDLD